MKSYDQLRNELDSKIPRSAVSTRDGGSGVKLDYLSNYYVKSRLNETLGQGNWSYKLIHRECVYSGAVKRYSGDVHSVSYLADVELTVRIGDTTVSFTDTGYGDGSDKTNPGKAHELAAKEAVTDALKRCVSNLGQSMGLALYEKEQSHVEEQTKKDAPNAVYPGRENSDANISTKPEHGQQRGNDQKDSAPTINGAPGEIITHRGKDIRAIKASIKAAARVLDAKKTLALAEFKTKYSVNKVDDLDDTATLGLYAKVKVDYPELKL